MSTSPQRSFTFKFYYWSKKKKTENVKAIEFKELDFVLL